MSNSIPFLNSLKDAKIIFFLYFCCYGILIALTHTFIALAHPNGTEKLYRLLVQGGILKQKVRSKTHIKINGNIVPILVLITQESDLILYCFK